MRPSLACSNVSATCLILPHSISSSHVSLVAALRHKKLAMHVVRCKLHSSKGRQVLRYQFAALSSQNVAVELEQIQGDLNKGVQGEQGLVSSVGTPAPSLTSLREWYLADKQFVVLSCSAFVTVGFMTILLAAAIPSLLAIKKAAESLEKLADTAREELPGTMAAIRLSGMEISDLTMELNDLGQEISRGVRSSARALNAAESGMRQVGGLASNVWQKQAVVPAQAMQPLVVRTAKRVRDGLVQTKVLVGNLQVLSRVTSWIGSLQVRTPILVIPFQKKSHES